MASRSARLSSPSEQAGGRRWSIGLTGGVGSGKSTVADLLAQAGVAIVDTDRIAHALTAPGGAAIASIRRAFGSEFIDSRGALDRARMRALVFGDAEAKKRLERLLHPMIRAETVAAAARVPPTPYVAFVVPLLVESGDWAERVDRVLVVDCSGEQQVERVARRSGLTRQAALAIMAGQADRATRLAAADDVIVNESALEDLRVRVARVHATYVGLARHATAPPAAH